MLSNYVCTNQVHTAVSAWLPTHLQLLHYERVFMVLRQADIASSVNVFGLVKAQFPVLSLVVGRQLSGVPNMLVRECVMDGWNGWVGGWMGPSNTVGGKEISAKHTP